MLSYLVGLWMAATAVGQAPAEASWLESVPAEIPVVARVRALEDVSGDLMAMLKAMSPNAAEAARGVIEPAIEQFGEAYSKGAVKNPFFVLFRLPDPDQPDLSGWGVIVKTGDAAAVIKGLGQDGEKPKALDGYESFAARDGQTWYAAKGTGWVAFGPDEAMIKAIHKPGSSLARALSPDVRARFLAGDAGLYLNLAEVQKRYGNFIEQLKPALLNQIEQAPNAGGARNVQSMKQVIDALIEGLKAGDRLALSLDFDAAGLGLSGLATVKADTPAAKDLARSGTGPGRLMEKLPGDKMVYVYTADMPGSSTGRTKPGAAATSPAVEKAVAARTKALEGRFVMGMTFMPMQIVSLADPQDPQAAVKATLEASKARQATEKEKTTIEPDALTYGGFRLTRSKTEDIDMKQIIKNAGNQVPNGEEILGKMFAGNAITTYMGTDGRLFLEVTASSEDQLKAQIDAIKDGQRNLGSSPSWKALRGRFPEQVSVLVLLSAQETVKMLVTGIGLATNNAGVKPPADLPRAPALLGFALIASPTGYDFRLIVPSDVGPVFEKGLAPLAGVE